MAEKIKDLVVDDQLALAEEIKNVLETDKSLEVVGTAENGLVALEYIKEYAPNIVLMDIRMPMMNGVVATQQIKSQYPEVKVIILTTFDDSDYILNAINNGASGYLLKDMGATALIDAVKNAFKGDIILPAKIAKQIRDYRIQYGYTFSGILGTLVYWYEVKQAQIDKANGGIGIVPYVYDQAKEYYMKIHQANALNENVKNYKAKVFEITIAPPEREVRQPRLFNIEEEN